MLKTQLVSGPALALTLVLGGCAEGSGSDTVQLGSCASALSAGQGLSMNGMQAQGLQAQGLQAQGLNFQGLSFQGLSFQGLTAQGISPQGIDFQGTDVSGSSISAGALDAHSIIRLELLEGELAATLDDGGVLRGADLQGLHLPFVTTEAETRWLQLVRAEGNSPGAWLYSLQLEGRDVCAGDGLGVFVPGVWDESGRHVAASDTAGGVIDATFSCRAGVIAKCVFWGYEPWSVGSELHQACTRMARADYCGDGVAHTENGTLIDMFDRHGIQSTVDAAGLSFEAGWGPDGATCVSQPRYLDIDPQGELELPSCWDSKPSCDTWEDALALGAVLGNDSSHDLRPSVCAAAAPEGEQSAY
jgi:hypothetical protein